MATTFVCDSAGMWQPIDKVPSCVSKFHMPTDLEPRDVISLYYNMFTY